MKDIFGKEIPPNPYDMNDTMRMLGKQYGAPIFWCNDEVRERIEQINQARPYEFTISAAADIFILGYIHGKRAERARRKKTA